VNDDDRVTEMAGLLDALDDHLRDSDIRVRRSEGNRLSLLHLHAAAALYIAPLFAAMGRDGMTGPAWALVRMIPGAPYTLAVLFGAGGLILGTATWFRAPRWEILGLCMLLAWYLTIAISFAGALLMWLGGAFPPSTPKPAPYAHGVYLHLSAVMTVHLVTLIRIRVAQRGLT
jgi:hypothetical protein